MIADVINDPQLVSYRGSGAWLLSDSRAQDAQGRLIGPDYINKGGAGYLRPEISSSLALMDIHLLSYPTYVPCQGESRRAAASGETRQRARRGRLNAAVVTEAKFIGRYHRAEF